MTAEASNTGAKTRQMVCREKGVGRSMTAADIYRRYAAECVSMSKRRENARDKMLLLQMATMWLRGAFSGTDHSRACDRHRPQQGRSFRITEY